MAESFFNIHDENDGIHRSLADGVTTRIFPGQHAMVSVVRIEAECASDRHAHPEEQWGVLLEGSGFRIQDGIEHIVSAGDFWQTPSGVPHAFRAGPNGALVLDVFSPPRAEYRKSGSGVIA